MKISDRDCSFELADVFSLCFSYGFIAAVPLDESVLTFNPRPKRIRFASARRGLMPPAFFWKRLRTLPR
jgi:hypothetical protein